MKKPTTLAFTLAEIMIVLTVIGILTAIILPSARNLMPDKNLTKFKKAHNILTTATTELINSDKYYLNGDLGVKPNGDLIDGTHEGDITYFCQTLADVLNTKSVNCSEFKNTTSGHGHLAITAEVVDGIYSVQYDQAKKNLDNRCHEYAVRVGEEIKLNDGVIIFQTAPNIMYGINEKTYRTDTESANCSEEPTPEYCLNRIFGETNSTKHFRDGSGFSMVYKIICIDIDGTPANSYYGKCVNECPFGYGIRADGKIFTGARADEWLKKESTN